MALNAVRLRINLPEALAELRDAQESEILSLKRQHGPEWSKDWDIWRTDPMTAVVEAAEALAEHGEHLVASFSF